ncbi:MAG: 50S ribosomal protein L4 [Bacilli bacterium]|jgi:large subunit ribosomal protein L4|nr:50S ribosomal protein L4 [Bacilli bacterium]
MPKVKLLNIKGEEIKDIMLNDDCWLIEPNDSVLHNAIILAQASLRQGTQSAKTRAEVRGGGRKPWRQKGTGRARHGSIRSPIWVGGGVAFAPKPRDYSKKMNRKERRLALKSALSYKVRNNNIVVLDELKLTAPKTKEMLTVLNNLKVSNKVLLVTDELDEKVFLAAGNLDTIRVITAEEINILDVVNANYLVVTEKAIKIIEEVLS